MKIPKKLKVGGHTYRIKFPYYHKEREGLVGTSNHELNIMMIAEVDTNGNKKSQSRINETLWHEIIHCIDYTYNCGRFDEETVLRLSEGLYQVLTDNFIIRPKEK